MLRPYDTAWGKLGELQGLKPQLMAGVMSPLKGRPTKNIQVPHRRPTKNIRGTAQATHKTLEMWHVFLNREGGTSRYFSLRRELM
jgi:hypothetical protein